MRCSCFIQPGQSNLTQLIILLSKKETHFSSVNFHLHKYGVSFLFMTVNIVPCSCSHAIVQKLHFRALDKKEYMMISEG